MQLEQTLEMYRPTQIQINLPEQRQRTYTIRDLESLSSTALYTGELQNGASDWRRSMHSIFGDDFQIGGSAFGEDKTIMRRASEEFERENKEFERNRKEFERKYSGLCNPTMGSSRPLDASGRPINEGYGSLTSIRLPESGVELHIHEQPGGITHLKYDKGWGYTEINSYDAAMADLTASKLDFVRFLGTCKLKLPESE